MNDIFVSKIVGSPTESSWSQASSTGKLYIALSLSSEKESDGIIAMGKNVLEQIQREFFAIDNKNLVEIKNAVEKVFIPLSDLKYSAVVGAIKDDILYIVTAGTGVVLIDRNNNLAQVAEGEEGKIIGFSGRLENDDIVVLETNEFNKKISNKLLAEYTGSHDNEKLAEDLAPFILESSQGEEAAIIINYKEDQRHHVAPVQQSEYLAQSPKIDEDEISDQNNNENEFEDSKNKRYFPNPLVFIQAKLKGFSKKQKVIIGLVVIVALLLIVSLFTERYMESTRANEAAFESIFNESSSKLENAKGLSSLNRGRALEEINLAIENIESNLGNFRTGSKEHNELTALLNELNALRDTLGGGTEIAGTSIFRASDSEILGNMSHITFNENGLIVIGKNGYAVISEDGEIDSEEEVEINSLKSAISDNTYLFLLGKNANRITISNGNTSEITDEASGGVDISYFGTNIYLLTGGGEVKRFSGASFSEANYFTGNPSFNGKPTSFAIDGSIYILTDKGSITKFTRGTQADDFDLDKHLTISKNALLYTNENLSNIYLLDIDNASISQISPTGKVSKQFNALTLQNAKDFTVNAGESKVFVVIDEQVYSFDL